MGITGITLNQSNISAMKFFKLLAIIFGLAFCILIFAIHNYLYSAKRIINTDPTYDRFFLQTKTWTHVASERAKSGRELNLFEYKSQTHTFFVNQESASLRKEIETLCPTPPWVADGQDGNDLEYWSPNKLPPLLSFPRQIQLAVNLDVEIIPGKYDPNIPDFVVPGSQSEWTTIIVEQYVPEEFAKREFNKVR